MKHKGFDVSEFEPFFFKAKYYDLFFYQDSDLNLHGPYSSLHGARVALAAWEQTHFKEAPKVNLHLSPEECQLKSGTIHGGAPPNVSLLRGHKTLKERVERSEFVLGLKKKRCPTCHRSMSIKAFRKHAIEGCRKGKEKQNANMLP